MKPPEQTPYSMRPRDSDPRFLAKLNELTELHERSSVEYARIRSTFFPDGRGAASLEAVPYVPIKLFKDLELKSIDSQSTYKIMKSSGTGGERSRIFLDKHTALLQTMTLASILRFWLGGRRPMLIVDSPSILQGHTSDSARAAAITGMMKFGTDHHWLLNEQGQVNHDDLELWLSKHAGERIFIFGFTFMVWAKLIEGFLNRELHLNDSLLMHGGGWKKMAAQAVSPQSFRERLATQFGIQSVHDYYGMVEQMGSIFVEVTDGILVPPTSSHIIIRDQDTLEPVTIGTMGLVQMLSTLPHSYPGHSILTDDLGMIVENTHRVDELGPIGIRILGRVPAAEARGCSDAVPSKVDSQ